MGRNSDMTGVCWSWYTAYQVNNVGAVLFVTSAIQLVMVLSLLALLAAQRKSALRGSVQAASYMVLPMYHKLLQVFVAALITYSVPHLFLPTSYTQRNPAISGLLFAAGSAALHYVTEGLTLLLLHSGMGTRVTERCDRLALAWAALTALVEVLYFLNPNGRWGLLLAYNAVLAVAYIAIVIMPRRLLFCRPALPRFALLMAVIYAVRFGTQLLLRLNEDAGWCGRTIGTGLLFGICLPPLIYYTLLQDSRYWLGIASFSDKGGLASPLLGTELRHSTAGELAQSSFGVSVPIVNFAHVQLRTRDVIGAGGTARVFRGSWMGRDVAVKMVFCMQLTRDVVRAFVKEADLLSSLDHVNVVSLKGVVVRPPALCILLELCSRGSLFDVLHRADVSLVWEARLRMALDAARGVACLHRQWPPLIHLDIKSHNFLVTEDFTVKLTDLELSTRSRAPASGDDDDDEYDEGIVDDDDDDDDASHAAAISASTEDRAVSVVIADDGKGTGQQEARLPELFNWVAPELITRSEYTEAADIYSLAMVLYEIATSSIPFERSMRDVEEAKRRIIENGERPTLPDSLPAPYAELVRACWATDAALRPTADDVVASLQDMLAEMAV